MGLIAMLKGEEPNPLELLFNYKNPGQYGEYLTEYALGKNNLPGYGKTVHNAYLPHKNQTTELDVVLIHEKGVFVFESKNYSGWIFGSADQPKWTQSLQNGEKKQFYNPIRQNVLHCKAIAEFLEISPQSISSYIVFSQRCELKKVPDNTAEYTIVRRPDMLKAMRRELNNKEILFSHQQVDAFAAKLQGSAEVTDEQKQAHVDEIKAKTEGTTCPFCGSELILRRGKYGEFYGCKAYPKCRFVRKQG